MNHVISGLYEKSFIGYVQKQIFKCLELFCMQSCIFLSGDITLKILHCPFVELPTLAQFRVNFIYIILYSAFHFGPAAYVHGVT